MSLSINAAPKCSIDESATVEFAKQGYLKLSQFLSSDELNKLTKVVNKFHQSWINSNHEFYQAKAINSAFLTSNQHLSSGDRFALFEFVSQPRIVSLVNEMFKADAVFMGTQLFFDPVNSKQHNYWHRDPQYHLTEDEQRLALSGPDVLHFRLALKDERGIEFVPGSHKNWDTEEELAVRLEKNGRKSHESISSGVEVPMAAGDLLVFSANMIHRGLYGLNRLALDILYCERSPELLEFLQSDCMPTSEELDRLENKSIFHS
jgi:ectoine hydroxylase-related dioxygenase (phytanoyl-CoA dioxygenase family)